MKGRTSLAELVPFDETVLFNIPKTGNAVGSFEDPWEEGVRIGSIVRDGMSLGGTIGAVFNSWDYQEEAGWRAVVVQQCEDLY